MQSLAGIGLRLESCRDMLVSGELSTAIAELGEIQIGIDREFDEVRAFVRSLAQADPAIRREASRESNTKFQIRAAFSGDGLLVEQIIQIMLEGIRNARQYGQARSAEINVREESNCIRITIDDDGVGFELSAAPPWTIASRVAECGGQFIVNSNISPGAHIEVEMPVS
jgi:signal transduction histidine kinase